MKNTSRNRKRSLINLAYKIVAKEMPEAIIERDPLRRKYPDINYGLIIEVLDLERSKMLEKTLKEAFSRRNYILYYCKTTKDLDDILRLRISGFYHK